MKKNNVIKRGSNTITAQLLKDEWIEKYGEFIMFKKEEYGTMWIAKDLTGKKYAFFSDYIRNPEFVRIIQCFYMDDTEI